MVPPLGAQHNGGCSNFIKGILVFSVQVLGAPSNLLGALSTSPTMIEHSLPSKMGPPKRCSFMHI